MKKLLTLLLAAGMVVSAANGASAVEMKVSGSWLNSFTFADNLFGKNALMEKSDDGSFRANQQLNVKLDMVMSEALSATLLLRVADGQGSMPAYQWGTQGTGGQGRGVTARQAYLDWLVPNTDVLVRMGRQGVATPSYTFGSPVLDTSIDGVMVNAPVNDMVAVNVGWLRPFAEVNAWDAPHEEHSSIDLAYLGVDVAADGFKVTPWGMIGFVGSEAGVVRDPAGNTIYSMSKDYDLMGWDYATENTMAYWAGIGGELKMFDTFKFNVDFL